MKDITATDKGREYFLETATGSHLNTMAELLTGFKREELETDCHYRNRALKEFKKSIKQ